MKLSIIIKNRFFLPFFPIIIFFSIYFYLFFLINDINSSGIKENFYLITILNDFDFITISCLTTGYLLIIFVIFIKHKFNIGIFGRIKDWFISCCGWIT